MSKHLFLLSLSLLVFFCTDCSKAQNVSKLNVQEFQDKLNATANAQLIDVRTPEEFTNGHLANAMNINVNSGDFESKVSMLDKNKAVFVYCLAGSRSSAAANAMSKMGFKSIYELQGGITKWNAAGKSLEGNDPNAKGMSLEDFRTQVSGDKLVLVDVYAKWCAPCRVMAPMLDSLAAEQRERLTVLKIDADANKNLLRDLGVSELPTFFLYRNGTILWTKIGLTTKKEFLDKLKES